MSEKRKPKVIILESNAAVSNHARDILEKEGWDVTCETVSKDALSSLSQSKKRLFALFISNFKLPKMEGDDVLLKVKSISPLTQRMLVVPNDKPETLIKAINKAEIHASIISPFKDENLINQAGNCLVRFKHALKQARLKRVTNHQNKQMLNIAKKLKKKSDTYKKLINKKTNQKTKLKSKKRKIQIKSRLNSDITLQHLLDHKKVTPTPDIYQKEFLTLCEDIKTQFEQLASEYGPHQLEPDLKTIIGNIIPQGDPDPKAPGSTIEDPKTLDQVTDAPQTVDPKITDQAAENPSDSETSGKDTADPELAGSQVDTTQEGCSAKERSSADLISLIINMALTRAVNVPEKELKTETRPEEVEEEHGLDEYFKISISDDQTKAWVKKIKEPDEKCPSHTLTDILDLLLQKEIQFGVKDDETIQNWLSNPSEKEILVSEGEAPIQGKSGAVKFYFKIDFTNPGKIDEDGTIDFRERGDIPFVKAGDLLAEKTMVQPGKAGLSISGVPIPVEEALDPVFEAGSGATRTEDGTCIHSDIDGQPHCDALGTISVSPELVIPGDVDFETGNIDFNGNILVKGMIKEGFTVKGINLTVQEIEGGSIDILGDLNVSAGITESNIHVHGNTQAKFINHSTVMGFGDVIVSKEILDSDIILSGCCKNSSGHIISSRISAKLGVEGGSIGTNSSTPVKLKVGVEEHLQILNKQIDENLEDSVNKATLLKDEVKKLEDEDQALYEQITEKAHIQDRAQLGINQLKKELPEIENSNDLTRLHQASKKIKQLKEKALEAEKKLNSIFKTQDRIAKDIEQLKEQIQKFEKKNKAFVTQKKALKEYAMKDQAKAFVSVAKTITQGSIIKGVASSIILSEDKSRCKILELGSEESGIMIYEIQITDL